MMKRIVWANDGSISADRARPVIRDLVGSTGAAITVACVHRDWHVGRRPVLVEDHRPLEEVLQHTVEELIGEGFDAELVVTSNDGGHPAQLVADLAQDEDADIIVTGSHGHGPVAGLLMGSFTGSSWPSLRGHHQTQGDGPGGETATEEPDCSGPSQLKVAHCPVFIVPSGHREPAATT